MSIGNFIKFYFIFFFLKKFSLEDLDSISDLEGADVYIKKQSFQMSFYLGAYGWFPFASPPVCYLL